MRNEHEGRAMAISLIVPAGAKLQSDTYDSSTLDPRRRRESCAAAKAPTSHIVRRTPRCG